MKKNPMTAGLPPVHPGAILREEILPALPQSKTEIAQLLGISRQTLYDILDEKQPVTVQMALRLGKLFGTSAESWINMQVAHDLKIKAREMAEELAAIPTLERDAA